DERLNVCAIDLAVNVGVALAAGGQRAAVVDRAIRAIAAENVSATAGVAFAVPRHVAGERALLETARAQNVAFQDDIEIRGRAGNDEAAAVHAITTTAYPEVVSRR